MKGSDQDRGAGGGAAFEIAMRFDGVVQRVFLIDRDFDRALADDIEQPIGDSEQILAFGGIGVQRRPGREQRSLGLQNVDVESVDLARRAAIADKIAERREAIERGRERGLADAVIDHLAQLAAGDFLGPRGEILIAIEDGVMAAIGLGERGLVLGADRADDIGAEMIGPLAQDQADAAGCGMNEDVHALLDLEGAAQQIFRRHAFEHHGGGLLVADIRRQFHGAVSRDVALGGVAAERHDIADAIADLEVADAGTDGDDLAGSLVSGDEGQADRRRIHAHAEIGVDEIDAAGVLLDADLALPRRRQFDLFVGQNLGPARLMHAYCRNHFPLL